MSEPVKDQTLEYVAGGKELVGSCGARAKASPDPANAWVLRCSELMGHKGAHTAKSPVPTRFEWEHGQDTAHQVQPEGEPAKVFIHPPNSPKTHYTLDYAIPGSDRTVVFVHAAGKIIEYDFRCPSIEGGYRCEKYNGHPGEHLNEGGGLPLVHWK